MKFKASILFTVVAFTQLVSCGGNEEKTETNSDGIAESVEQTAENLVEEKDYSGYTGMSVEFLDRLEAGKSTDDIAERYANLTFEELEEALDTEQKKKAFWLNTYNSFVQHILIKDPSLYDDRDDFFKREQVEIAGTVMSFDEIEHGIIRSNKWKLGAGYLPRISNEHTRKLKLDSTDGRVHLALNCGAKSCPEIAIYEASKVDNQLDIIAKRYLVKTTEINGNTVTVTPLMSWFRGDFEGKNGIKEDYLVHYGIIDSREGVELEFGDYDWTLDLGNFTEL